MTHKEIASYISKRYGLNAAESASFASDILSDRDAFKHGPPNIVSLAAYFDEMEALGGAIFISVSGNDEKFLRGKG